MSTRTLSRAKAGAAPRPPEQPTEAQRRIIEAPPVGETTVGGVAGSGKTLAAVHRAVALAAAAPQVARNPVVLFLCFNSALANRVREQLRAFPSTASQRVAVFTVHQWCYRLIRRRYPTFEVVSDDERFGMLRAAIDELRRASGPRDIFDFEGRFWSEAVRQIKGCRLARPDDFLSYRRAAGSTLTDEDELTIFAVAEAYNRRLREIGRIDYDDYAPIALADPDVRGGVAHVIVDEAQDLSAAQIDLCRAIAHDSLLIVADQDQAIYHVARLPASLPAPDDYDLHLPESIRCTSTIFAHARRLLPRLADLPLPARDGPPPSYRHLRWSDEEAEFVADRVSNLIESGIPPAEIAVLARLRELLPPLDAALAAHNIPVAEAGRSGVSLSTIHAVKGHEFRVVLLAGLVEGVLPRIMPDMDRAAVVAELDLARRQLYVAMTRAREQLILSSSEGLPSRLLAEIGIEAVRR